LDFFLKEGMKIIRDGTLEQEHFRKR